MVAENVKREIPFQSPSRPDATHTARQPHRKSTRYPIKVAVLREGRRLHLSGPSLGGPQDLCQPSHFSLLPFDYPGLHSLEGEAQRVSQSRIPTPHFQLF